jgi:DNA-binding transcriptional LysR family regulator
MSTAGRYAAMAANASCTAWVRNASSKAVADRVREVPVRPALRPFRIAACARRRSFANPLVRAFWETLPS